MFSQMGNAPHPHILSTFSYPDTNKLTAVPVAGAIAGATAAAAYLDAKFHLTQDIRTIRGTRATESSFAKAGTLHVPRSLQAGGASATISLACEADDV